MGEGMNEFEAVRKALADAAFRPMRRPALAREAARLAADPVDRAERKALLAEMEALSPEWLLQSAAPEKLER